ncbi:hypothetical protein RBWH47_01550 [Rhodopirellula baltica WH47]|uniref:Uncharacterized protein n=1 Tax=Rhodopirellula baltica WH47 TaxID=991778 RepID=F2ARY1_RHOBT|nr:hypothetical protein RBWH47_01550 [Rhodopirellula baltica WH47]
MSTKSVQQKRLGDLTEPFSFLAVMFAAIGHHPKRHLTFRKATPS